MNDQPREEPSLDTLNKHLEALKKTQASETKSAPTGDAARAAIDFASATAVGSLLGYAVDQWQGWSPWGLLTGLALGCASGLKLMLHAEALRAKRAEKQEPKE